MLTVKVTTKVPQSEDLFFAKGDLQIGGEDHGAANVLVKDLGDGKAELVIVDKVRKTELDGKGVAAFKGNTVSDYKGSGLKKGVELCFSLFSFVHK